MRLQAPLTLGSTRFNSELLKMYKYCNFNKSSARNKIFFVKTLYRWDA